MENAISSEQRLQLCRLVMTPGVRHLVQEGQLDPLVYLERHLSGDWGNVSEPDRRANEQALRHKDRVLSSYQIAPTLILWIITECDRSATTLLLPHEY